MYRATAATSHAPLSTEIAAGAPVFGTFCGSSDPVAAERQSAAGWDFIILDLQHGAATSSDLVPLTMAVELGGAASLVRVPWNSPSDIMRALDSGAQGVVVPMVSNAAEAASAASACRYPPLGERSFGQLRGSTYGGTDGANAAVLCFVMIETAEAIKNIDEIVNTPGVDGVFVGPVDLALGLGLPVGTPTSDPRYESAHLAIQEACIAAGKSAGGFIFAPADIAKAVASGWQFIAVMPNSDIAALRALPVPERADAGR